MTDKDSLEVKLNRESIDLLKQEYPLVLSDLISYLIPKKEDYLKLDPETEKIFVTFDIPLTMDIRVNVRKGIHDSTRVGNLSSDCYIQLLFEAINRYESCNPNTNLKGAFIDLCENMNSTQGQFSGSTGRFIFCRASRNIPVDDYYNTLPTDFEYLALCFVAVEEVLKTDLKIQPFVRMGYNTIPGPITFSF